MKQDGTLSPALFDDLIYKYYSNERSNRLWAIIDAAFASTRRGYSGEDAACNGRTAYFSFHILIFILIHALFMELLRLT